VLGVEQSVKSRVSYGGTAPGVDEGPPAATRGRKKPFLLDPILD
jgi:hypothetical protein